MDLPDCPPGAEGYEDTVIEVPKKLTLEENCTKAEKEFKDHLNSLKIKLENGETRSMVERRGRDISGKWIYLCYPCAAVCSGETILQTHISGKKHKVKLAMKTVWPKAIFDEHPYIVNEKGGNKAGGGATDKVLQKMAEEVDLHNKDPSELDVKYGKYKNVRCHIQDSLDNIKAPLVGVEYLVEHPPEQAHYEPSYVCTMCVKQGHPRTITNHMTCFWHRYNYLLRHFPQACSALAPYRGQTRYREGVNVIMNRLAQRIEDKYGRLRPVNIDKEEYEKDKERIHQWIFKGYHFSENGGQTFEEVVDIDLITSLVKSQEDNKDSLAKAKDPSPPVVAAPKPHFNSFTRSATRQERRAGSVESLSDISDDQAPRRPLRDERQSHRGRHAAQPKPRYEPYPDKRRESPTRHRFTYKNDKKTHDKQDKKAPNYEYKVKLAEEKRKAAEDSAKKTLAYHEKNPEKHPLYPEEWKKFWNRRYKEIQAEGKDPSKHDFKPEWIVFWTGRMKELHDEEMRVNIHEIYRKLCLEVPENPRPLPEKRKSPEPRRRSPEPRRRSIEPRRRSPEYRRHPEPRADHRRISPGPRRRSPPDFRRDRRTPDARRSPFRRRSVEKRHSPLKRSRSPIPRARSPARTHITLESVHRSRSPLSRRNEALRNRSPQHAQNPQNPPSMQTVMISDDELRPDDGLSPWNSDNDLDSLGSLPDARSPIRMRSHSRTASVVSSHASRSRKDYPIRGPELQDLGPPENVVATLRLLVALEDYLGSLGPKIVDLLTEALKMEKEKGNSSEELLVRESAVVLIETAKEKLKGAVQAGLVPHGAAPAVRTAVVRAAATLHEADTRAKRRQQTQYAGKPPVASVPVAGVGEVDRAQIAQQMAEALIAQGKTDVSSEELAQLVDAVCNGLKRQPQRGPRKRPRKRSRKLPADLGTVDHTQIAQRLTELTEQGSTDVLADELADLVSATVGIAEAKKRQAEVKKKVEARAVAEKASRPQLPIASTAAMSGTASALQMLQSAYDENDRKLDKEDAPDAMDGLSDSDLETLLKNFNELSAEEQHSLIAYLKKLEAREPQRVERLRQYVSAAANTAPVPDETVDNDVKPVTIESDDDDYTVEEVFQSATQKVKENQIRQEMEIVKKSLEETKSTPSTVDPPKAAPTIDLTKNMSSATDLLALVQASIQSTAIATPASIKTADVVVSNVQPRSFGDIHEAPIQNVDLTKQSHLQNQAMNPKSLLQQQTPFGNQGGFRQSPNQNINFGVNRNFTNEPYHENPSSWEQRPNNNMEHRPMNPMNNMEQRPMNAMGNMDQRPMNPMGNMDQRPMSLMNNMDQRPMNPMNNMDQRPMNIMDQRPMNSMHNMDQRPMNLMDQRPMNPMNMMQDNRGSILGAPPMRGAAFDNFGQDPYNQGPRGNFMNGRMQDNYDTRPPDMNQQQQFGNYDQGNNFRGRGGRGNFGGPMRGRGRGGYY